MGSHCNRICLHTAIVIKTFLVPAAFILIGGGSAPREKDVFAVGR